MSTTRTYRPPRIAEDVCAVPGHKVTQHLSRRASSGQRTPVGKNNLTEEQQELLLDISQIVLDIVGIFEPTPFADGTNAAISFKRDDHFGGWIGLISMIPYLGDLAKVGKFPKYMATIKRVSLQYYKSTKFASLVEPYLRELSDALELLAKLKGEMGSSAAALNKQITKMLNKGSRAFKAASRSGMAGAHIKVVLEIAKERGLIIIFRNTNLNCLKYIKRGFPAKPIEISAKTQEDGLVRAISDAEYAQALNAGFMVVEKGGKKVAYLDNAGKVVTKDLPKSLVPPNMSRRVYTPQHGHIIHKNAELPLTGDYDLLAILDPKDLNKNATGMALGAKGTKSITNAHDNEVIAALNRGFEGPRKNYFGGPRIKHGTHEHFKPKSWVEDKGKLRPESWYESTKDVTVFMPDGETVLGLTQESGEIQKLFKAVKKAAKAQQ